MNTTTSSAKAKINKTFCVGLLLTAVGLALAAAPAHAYVRSRQATRQMNYRPSYHHGQHQARHHRPMRERQMGQRHMAQRHMGQHRHHTGFGRPHARWQSRRETPYAKSGSGRQVGLQGKQGANRKPASTTNQKPVVAPNQSKTPTATTGKHAQPSSTAPAQTAKANPAKTGLGKPAKSTKPSGSSKPAASPKAGKSTQPAKMAPADTKPAADDAATPEADTQAAPDDDDCDDMPE